MYVFDLQKKMIGLYGDIMVNAIDKISKKNNSIFLIQNIEESNYYGRLKESQCRIFIEMGIEKAYNLIRGVSMPYFGAEYDKYKIWKAKILDIHTYNQFYSFFSNGIHFNTKLGDIIKFDDGILLIEKFNLIKK